MEAAFQIGTIVDPVRRELMLLLVVYLSACVPAAHSTREPADAGRERTVRITEREFGTEVTVSIGDILAVSRPADFAEWDVAFASEVLRSLDTAADRRRPPATGWRFEAIDEGTTDIAFTAYVAGRGNVPRYIVTITVR